MESIIKSFSKHGTFVQPDTLEYILSKDKPNEFVDYISKNLKEYPLILTVDHIIEIEQEMKNKNDEMTCDDQIEIKSIQKKIFNNLFNKIENGITIEKNEIGYDYHEKNNQNNLKNEETIEKYVPAHINIKKTKSWKPESKEYESEIRIFKDITGKSTCEGTTSDFTKLFLNRYEVLRKILRNQRREMANILPICKIKSNDFKEIQIIGIITNLRTTKNGHKLIEIEDETGSATAIALKTNREITQLANEIILDEILGLKCKISKDGDLLIIQNIVFPDISVKKEKNKSEIPVCVAFLSDIHMGSKMFLNKEWESFLQWINGQKGNSRQRNVAGHIKYLVIPGDVADGIGIYPDQHKELMIPDVYGQYEALAEQLQLIPDYISIIMQPGNHDAVRPAEPQPTFEKEIQDLFSGKDIIFVGNPCYFSLNNVEILSYHGQSLLDFATHVRCLKYNDPVEIMKTMLKKHHLSPTYGGYTPLAPEHMDYMVIEKTPDIFVTGHVHLATIGEYRGVTLINASSWQSQTSYQKMLNFIPDPAKIPIANLETGNVTMMDFKGKF